MIAATLFSGIGAPECAMPDWDWKWCAENEDFPSAVHAIRHGTKNLGDITADDFVKRASEFGPIDVLVFGSPCQGFSSAGNRLGLDDPRSNLALVSLGIIKALRPRWFVFENVPGLLSSGKGEDYKTFLSEIEKCGYLGAWRILNARYFGVPQQRRRLFFIGYLGDWRPSFAVLFERESLRRDSSPNKRREEDDFSASVGSVEQFDSSGRLFSPIAVNIRGRDGGAMPEICEYASVRAASGGASRSYIATNILRRLTPTECEALQGFSKGFTAIPWKGRDEEKCPHVRRYKAVGNSMAVPVMKWILNRLEIVDGLIEGRSSELTLS